MTEAGEAIEAIVKHHNTAELSEGRMLRKLLREISPFTSDFEFRVLLFIFDRTYTYGKTAEVIPMKHFLEGVKLGTGEILHPRVHASRRSVYRALQKLVDNVIIITAKTHRTATPSYAINPVWTPYLCQRWHKLVSSVAQASATGVTYNKKNITHDTQQVARVRASAGDENMLTAKERLLLEVNGASTKSKAAREKNKQKCNATGLMKMWEDAFIGTYPEETYFRWRVYEQSAFKKATERGIPTGHIEAFINFVVGSFDNVINEHFSWMKSRPTIPAVGFVTKHMAEFYQAYNDSIDPNRRIRGRVNRSNDDTPKKDKPNGNASSPEADAEIERLRKENEKLRAQVTKPKRVLRTAIKRLVTDRPRRDEEFGSWD